MVPYANFDCFRIKEQNIISIQAGYTSLALVDILISEVHTRKM